jgi:hypothetical protein
MTDFWPRHAISLSRLDSLRPASFADIDVASKAPHIRDICRFHDLPAVDIFGNGWLSQRIASHISAAFSPQRCR